MANAAGVGAFAQTESQGAEQDRLPGPGFAGNGGHAAGKFQVEAFDDGVVTNGKLGQHLSSGALALVRLGCR
ncbi:hypothetical protein Q427_04495 [Halomonas sp. BC04]|nr:hypothetical protein Q427_04495 [Halomonas sp. BC04]